MEVSGKDLTIYFKKEIDVSISQSDFKLINLINESSDLNNKIILIGNNHYEIQSHNIENNILTLKSEVYLNDRYEDKAYLFFDKYDLINSGYFSENLTGIITDKNLIITGGLFLEDCSLYLDSGSKLYVNNGTLKVNRVMYNSIGIPISTNLVKIVTTGSYGKDNYRQSGNKSVVNGTGTLDFNTLWWCQDSESRSDWDLTENSKVTLLNTRLIGPNNAYHHILSKNCTIDGFIVLNSYSIELMVTPIFIRAFQSINCHYGLSFYPPGNTPFIKLYNVGIQQSVVHIKRNNRSNIVLVDPSIDLTTMIVSGSTPIKVLHSASDKIVNHLGEPLNNILITYLYQPIHVNHMSGKTIDLSEYVEFIHFIEGDTIYVSDSNKSDHLGELRTVVSVSDNIIEIDSVLSQTYDVGTFSVRKHISYTSNEQGDVPSIEIPYAFMGRDSNILKYYNVITKIYSIKGENHKQTIFAYKGSTDVIQSSMLNQSSDTSNNVYESLQSIENKLTQLLESNTTNNEFYTGFVSEYL
jgi:hypothetical protein